MTDLLAAAARLRNDCTLAREDLGDLFAAWLEDAERTWDVVRPSERHHVLAVAQAVNGGQS